MFNAAYIIKYSECLSREQRDEYLADAERLSREISAVNLVKPLLPGSVPDYNLYIELGFKDETEFKAAKMIDAWADLRARLSDSTQTAAYEYAAFGNDIENFSDRHAGCHRLLIFHILPDVPEERIRKMKENIVRFPDYVPGMVSCKIAKVVESSGSMDWNCAFDVDFELPGDYLGWYLHSPYHWAYIDRYFEPSSCDFCIDPHLCSVYCQSDSSFLSNYRA